MHLVRVRLLHLIVFAAAVVAAGCGDGARSLPTAPSALPVPTAQRIDAPSDTLAWTTDEFVALGGGNNHGGAFNNGNGGGKDGSGRGKDKERVDDTDDADAGGDGDDDHGDRRNLSGFVTAVGADSITIRGVIVKITPSTVIRHGHRRLSLAQIAVGDHAQAKGLISADGTMMTATEIKVEDTGNDNDDEEVELSGAVADLSGTCPSVTFKIGTTTVATSASTTFAGIACSALVNGTRVEVEGTLSGTTLTATKVELD